MSKRRIFRYALVLLALGGAFAYIHNEFTYKNEKWPFRPARADLAGIVKASQSLHKDIGCYPSTLLALVDPNAGRQRTNYLCDNPKVAAWKGPYADKWVLKYGAFMSDGSYATHGDIGPRLRITIEASQNGQPHPPYIRAIGLTKKDIKYALHYCSNANESLVFDKRKCRAGLDVSGEVGTVDELLP